MRQLISWLSVFGVFLIAVQSAFADGFVERRRDQFPKEHAYLFVPLPYSYPGIGEGLFLIANGSNVLNSTTDLFYVEIVGDATGRVAQVEELPLIRDQLFLTLQFQDINRAIVNQYDIRGMNGNKDYKLLDVSQADHEFIRLDYSLDQRRHNFYYFASKERFTLDRILDKDGNIILDLADPYKGKGETDLVGYKMDLTDDYLDPRKGIRLGIEYIDRPDRSGGQDPDYYVLNYNLVFYQPMSDADTLVVNYYQSDAHVRRIGNINPADIRTELGLNCGADPVCLDTETLLVNNTIAARTYGTSTDLGGLERLRSYPQGRFSGAHTGFLGVEYRWNLTEEATPFNYLFWKDVRTGKQIAFFAEAGSVSEKSSELWDEQRYSYGVGFRLLAASGSVYRADIAYGEEGTEVAIFFFYPW